MRRSSSIVKVAGNISKKRIAIGACRSHVRSLVGQLVSESVEIRGISRILEIGASTVMRRIIRRAKETIKPTIFPNQLSFEVDELWIGFSDNQRSPGCSCCPGTALLPRCNVYDLSTIKRPDIRTVRERGEMRKREQGVKRFRPVEVVGRE
jgi:hypothetical protein